jgi:hypothetical protein
MRQLETFTASSLFCPHCQRSMKVRERLLRILPDGALCNFQYVGCDRSPLGTRKEGGGEESMERSIVV